ncbi:protein tyrosine/serine phosphatase [Phycicoccus badiiscoriae]|uniref:Protein tyrosine/serine phosphatase n=1 Tax=Pedococcus badiiscoriae TaxID=642776 RepID=A0A852WPF6_9MICO|nr:protein tyrosine/serine phosphatase [Pedococcus badiiscoriae]
MATPLWIELDGVVNMRDLGGLPTTDGGEVATGRLLRSDNLQDLSEADVDALTGRLGVTDVVDLRSTVELHLEGPGPLRARNLTHHHHHSLFRDDIREVTAAEALVLPWSKADQAAVDAEPRLDDDYWASHYLGYLAHRPDSISAALRVVSGSRGATIVHCAAGKDRTGTVVGLALSVAGVSDEDVVADYVATGERIERVVARLMARPAYGEALAGQSLDHHRPKPQTMERILTVLAERYGGASGWLRAQGWTEDEVEALRASLRA